MGSILNTHGLGTIPDNTTEGPKAFLKRDDAHVRAALRDAGLENHLPQRLGIAISSPTFSQTTDSWNKNLSEYPEYCHWEKYITGITCHFFLKTNKWKHFKENSWDCRVTGQLLCRVTFGLGMSEKQMFIISGYRGVRVHLFPELNPDHHRKERLIL